MAQFRIDTKKFSTNHDVTRYEVMMLSDRLTPSGTLTDAFGRLRISDPLTLFDSQHRYYENGKWNTSNTANSTAAHNANESSIYMTVPTANNEYVYRETTRVFAYQPGKSLLIMNTFAMATPTANLVQRVGYFGTDNGVFFENDSGTNYLVLRSNTTGTITETRVAQSNWNMDKFDGTDYSSQGAGSEHGGGLDVSKTNIFWIDIEWLGVGDVRCGFVVDGRLVPAHIFHNDNAQTAPYMTTACLPIRYEIKTKGIISESSTMKQICSTVISEGGYSLTGKQKAVGYDANETPKDIPSAGTYVPIISIRINPNTPDAIVIPTAIDFIGLTNNTRYSYKIILDGTLGNAAWTNASTNSFIQYDKTANTITGGTVIDMGYVVVSAGSGSHTIKFEDGLFKNQFERNSFTGNTVPFTLAATGAGNGDDAMGAITWEEITR
jgi:hypothetical protein